MNGWSAYSILPIRKERLEDLRIGLETPFLCIFSKEETLADSIQFIGSVEIPILHVSTESPENSIAFKELTRDHVLQHISLVVSSLERLGLKEELLPLIKIMGKTTKWDRESTDGKRWNHLTTLPNELVLSSLGFDLREEGPLISSDNGPYVQAIANSAEAIMQLRTTSGQYGFTTPYSPAVSLILTAQSLYRHAYKVKPSLKEVQGVEGASAIIKAHRLLKKQRTFVFTSSSEEFREIFGSPAGSIAIKIRKDETAAYTIGLAVKACSNIAPVLRLPPVVNTLHNELENLGACARGNSPNKLYKTNKIFRRIANRLSEIVEPTYLSLLPKDLSPIKVIADLPLEWLQVRDLPLMLKFDVSRIPTTPGDLSFYQSIISKYIVVHPKEFEQILIVRSFRHDDPVRNVLETSLKILNKAVSLQPKLNAFSTDREFQERIRREQDDKDREARRLNITLIWADVKDESEFVRSVNSYNGPIMIFDGHGTHEKDGNVGSLVIGTDKVDLWSLRGKVRIPPIVLLSACDTHPVDSSHASVASGFLAAGATTVLGTVLPIDATPAAVFITRLVLRLREFLPVMVQEQDDCLRWTRVVSGLQRMSYVTELLYLLNRKGDCYFSADAYHRISFQANNLINGGVPGWYDRVLEIMAEEVHEPIDRIRAFARQWAQIPECLKYVQLGNPELIFIAQEAFFQRPESREIEPERDGGATV
jgi:hypothetical protein